MQGRCCLKQERHTVLQKSTNWASVSYPIEKVNVKHYPIENPILWNFKLVWTLKLLTKNFLHPSKSKTFTLPNVDDSAKSNSPVPVLGYQFKAHSLSRYWSERTRSNLIFSWQFLNVWMQSQTKLMEKRHNNPQETTYMFVCDDFVRQKLLSIRITLSRYEKIPSAVFFHSGFRF